MRAPIMFETSWESQQDELTPEQRGVFANIQDMDGLQNFDVIVNLNEQGYRNTGTYVYKDNGVYPLSDYPDDYGTLPEWVEVRKEDCGFSYFRDYLIDHNTYVPFRTNEWEICNSFVDTTTLRPFKFAYTDIEIITGICRKSDGATANISTTIRISAPWLGGPTSNTKPNGSGTTGKASEHYESFVYENGNQHQFKFKYGGEASLKQLTEPLNECAIAVHIPTHIVELAEHKVHTMITQRFQQPETMYLEAYGDCKFVAETSDFPTSWNGEETLGVTTVIAIDSDDE
jgi:hypothetical protein